MSRKSTYPRCNKCLWWESYSKYKGMCYAHPVLPLSMSKDGDMILWPTTRMDDRCSEFCEYIESDYADPDPEES